MTHETLNAKRTEAQNSLRMVNRFIAEQDAAIKLQEDLRRQPNGSTTNPNRPMQMQRRSGFEAIAEKLERRIEKLTAQILKVDGSDAVSPEKRVKEAEKIICDLMGHLENVQDDGPEGEGWQSDELVASTNKAFEFLQG